MTHPSKAALIDFYSQWHGERTYVSPMTVVRALQQRDIPSNARILDIGFGNGAISVAVAQAFPEGWVEGIDLTERNVTLAHVRAQTQRVSNISFRVADIEIWEPPADHYDAVLAMQVVQFIAAPDALLARVWRALRPGGVFFFATPFLPPHPHLHAVFRAIYTQVIPYSFQYRTEDAWYHALFDAGFERIYTAKAHWDPNTQPTDWQRIYRQTVAEHGLDYETARRHTWGGLISARKSRT